ncbi:MAG: hypothetical protein HYW88_01425 [Candidatus Sungbacteria bacterium]|nr:hypothetical protein [Candidatus Sungbacteria bacterium]
MPKHSKMKVAAGVGAGVAALAAAGAAAYFLYGSKHAASNRKKVAGWAVKARREIVRDLKKVKKFDQATYHKAVNGVINRYARFSHVDKKELAALAKHAKSQWKNIQRHIAKSRKPAHKKGKR